MDDELNKLYEQYPKSDEILVEEQSLRRQELRVEAVKDRIEQIKKHIQKVEDLKNYDIDHPCTFCRDLPNGYNLKFTCKELYGLIIKGDNVYCPECNECLVSWEH